MKPSLSSINPDEIKRVRLLRLRMKLHGLMERNPTKLVDDANLQIEAPHKGKGTPTKLEVEVPEPATKIVEKPVQLPPKKFNEIEMRQRAKQAAEASLASVATERGAEAAALSAAYNQQDRNFLT